MKPSSAKAKGRVLQQHVSRRIVESFPELATDDVVSRPMGSGGVDLMMSPLAQKKFPISVECKNTKAEPSTAALEQATYNCYPNTFPAVAWKPKGKGLPDTMIMMYLDDFLKLMGGI
jgi:hypothetical protein